MKPRDLRPVGPDGAEAARLQQSRRLHDTAVSAEQLLILTQDLRSFPSISLHLTGVSFVLLHFWFIIINAA